MEQYKTMDLELTEAQEMVFNMIKHEGALQERERIIALLEAEWWMRPSNKVRLIALIKGDDKW